MWMGTRAELGDYAPVLRWLLVMSFVALAFAAFWHFGLLQRMLATDVTHISTLILAVFVLTSLHCLYHTIEVSKQLMVSRRARDGIRQIVRPGTEGGIGEVLDDGIVGPGELRGYIDSLRMKSALQRGGNLDQMVLLRALADRLRAREKLGLFLSEALLRLALLGTAIGFILMLIPISGLRSFEPDTLRTAMGGMTGGMAIALNVTVTGIACSLVLKLEYYMLDNSIEELFGIIVDTTEVYLIPVLERPGNA
jgi:hypothetical protein